MKKKEHGGYILGLDIGANSIGWAMLKNEDSEKGNRIIRTGARIFEAGTEGDIESGKDQSRGIARREARSTRRRLDRHARRLNNLFTLFQQNGLLPVGANGEPPQLTGRTLKSKTRHDTIVALEKKLIAETLEREGKGDKESRRHIAKTLPYILRAKALDQKLAHHAIGRALYHLAQRRGFLSNRKTPAKKDEDMGVVKKEIAGLAKEIADSGSRTLGEYFSRIDPEKRRIRSRWTARKMYEDEFDAIWAAQQKHYPDILTEELGAKVKRTIFYQRPLKIQKHLVGKCELEPDCSRAPMALLDAQRFRMLQQLNHSKIITPQGELLEFSAEQRATIISQLEVKGDIKFKEAKKILGLSPRHLFNFEDGGESRFLGNRTAGRLVGIFGEERWGNFSDNEKNRVVEDVLSIQKDTALARRGMKAWGLDETAAKKFGELELEQGYGRLSRKAFKKLIPHLEKGTPYMTAVLEVYDPPAPEPAEVLPPVVKELSELRNPVVSRALTELRKVVNSIVHDYGKPTHIRVELARDLKKSRKQREETWKKNRTNEKSRKDASETIIQEAGITEPRRDDTLKYLLAVECDWKCPYTGKAISMDALFKSSQFDIEHIIPFSRCLDDSFMNKTLCHHEENRNVKRGHTPYEAYSHNPGRWEEILQRVRDFKGNTSRAKLDRFKLQSLETIDDFASKQLNDTRYATKLAKKYLGLLYGGEASKRPVQAGRGQITAYLRNEWNLNRILGDGGEKSRDDHRHHAVDAIAIALTNPGIVQKLSKAAERALSERKRRFGKVDLPWESFYDDVKKSIDSIIVSHRVSRKVSGHLHKESFYSPPRDEHGRVEESGKYIHIRVPVDSDYKISDIIDKTVKEAVENKLKELGDNRKKLKDALPQMPGSGICIKKVRIRDKLKVEAVGKAYTINTRYVQFGSTHHIEIIATQDKKGNDKWEGYVVSTYEASKRLETKEPMVNRNHGENKKFIFSLVGQDVIEIDEKEGTRGLYIIRTIPESKQIAFVSLNEARKKKDILDAKAWKTAYPDTLRKLNCRKVTIGPLGDVRWAND